MTTKKLASVLLVILVFAMCVPHAWAAGSKPQELTMLVVPARYSALQVGFDVIARTRTVLVSYQTDAKSGESVLYAWNGREWVGVPFADYADASFLQISPTRAIIVGGDDLLPKGLISSTSWCPKVLNITALDTASIVNALGNLLAFSKYDWQWFSKRYNLQLEDTNAERRKNSWYTERHDRIYLEGRTKEIPRPPAEPGYTWKETVIDEPVVEESAPVIVEETSYTVEDDYSVQDDVGTGEPKSILSETVDEIMEQSQ
ncbi:MAG: hypothetical protein KJ626_16335 [Verrucomicrobia bacterium]|nr:hypothetical protein [Verrucomicrobiota bacterium]